MSAWTELLLGLSSPEVVSYTADQVPAQLNGNYIVPVMWFSLFDEKDVTMIKREVEEEEDALYVPEAVPVFRVTQEVAIERLRHLTSTVRQDSYLWSVLQPLELMEELLAQQPGDSWVMLRADGDGFIDMRDPKACARLIASAPSKLLLFQERLKAGLVKQACRTLGELAELSELELSGNIEKDIQSTEQDAKKIRFKDPLEFHVFRTVGWPSWCRDKKIEERWRQWLASYAGPWRNVPTAPKWAFWRRDPVQGSAGVEKGAD